MTDLHEIAKQVDALTYNSRSVLNALVRSTVAAGSYNGYSVTRAGEEVSLSRLDIYRLYSFYQDWAYSTNYVNTYNEFYELVSKHDNKDTVTIDGVQGAVGQKTTDALVKHAKMMYMTTENVSESDEYWMERVRLLANPKLFTNTAPIPINLRTPIYDENLSTKNFSQFETYLFPAAYNTLHMLGYAGDDEDHYAGGHTWTFETDEGMTFKSPYTSIGKHDKSDIHDAAYSTDACSLDVGYNSYAYGLYSLSTGYGSASTRSSNSGVSLGSHAFTDAYAGAVVGGTMNRVAYGNGGAVVGGYMNDVVGARGFAANVANSVGGYSYQFTTRLGSVDVSDNNNTTTVGDDTYVAPNGCIYQLVTDSDTSVVKKNASVLGANQICIRHSDVAISGMATVDFLVGDTLVLYAMSRTSNGTNAYDFYHPYGYPYTYLTRTVTNIDATSKYGVIVSFDGDVSQVAGPNSIGGGRVAKIRGPWTFKRRNGSNVRQSYIDYGYASVALNYNTVAMGAEQTVVGSSNLPMVEPSFIVGAGSSYIERHREGSSYVRSAYIGTSYVGTAYISERVNSFVSAPNYTYMKPTSELVGMGVSTYSNNSFVFSSSGTDEDSVNRVYKFAGAYAYSMSDINSRVAARMVTNYIGSRFTINDNGIVLANPTATGLAGTNANVSVGSASGSTIIYSGGTTVFPTRTYNSSYVAWYKPYTTYVPNGRKSSIVMAANDNIVMHSGYQMYLNSTSYLTANFSRLYLNGDTYGTLAADAHSMSHVMGTSGTRYIMNPGRIPHSGFYYTNYISGEMDIPHNAYGSTISGNATQYIGAFHVLSSSYATTTSGYDISALLMPGRLTDAWEGSNYISARPHPILMNTSIVGNKSTTHMAEQLAFVSDFDRFVDRGHVTTGSPTWTSNTRTGTYGGVRTGYIDSNYGIAAYISATSNYDYDMAEREGDTLSLFKARMLKNLFMRNSHEWIKSDTRIDSNGRVYMDSLNTNKLIANGDTCVASDFRFTLSGGVMMVQFNLNGDSQLFRVGQENTIMDKPLKELYMTIPLPKSLIRGGMRQASRFTGTGYSFRSKVLHAEADLITTAQSMDTTLGMAIPAYTLRVKIGTGLIYHTKETDNYRGTEGCGTIPISLVGMVQYNDF